MKQFTTDKHRMKAFQDIVLSLYGNVKPFFRQPKYWLFSRLFFHDFSLLYYKIYRKYEIMRYLRIDKSTPKMGTIKSLSWNPYAFPSIYPKFYLDIETKWVRIQLNQDDAVGFYLNHEPTIELAQLIVKLIKKGINARRIETIVKHHDRDWYEL